MALKIGKRSVLTKKPIESRKHNTFQVSKIVEKVQKHTKFNVEHISHHEFSLQCTCKSSSTYNGFYNSLPIF
jgi:hypothetical protein